MFLGMAKQTSQHKHFQKSWAGTHVARTMMPKHLDGNIISTLVYTQTENTDWYDVLKHVTRFFY